MDTNEVEYPNNKVADGFKTGAILGGFGGAIFGFYMGAVLTDEFLIAVVCAFIMASMASIPNYAFATLIQLLSDIKYNTEFARPNRQRPIGTTPPQRPTGTTYPQRPTGTPTQQRPWR